MSRFGASSSPGGVGPLGGYIPTETAPQSIIKPTVAFFDPATMTSPVDAMGALLSMHPVDQKAVLSMSVDLGQIASTPEIGHTLRQQPPMTTAKIPADVQDRVNQAMAAQVAAGDISPPVATTTLYAYGRKRVQVDYTNLRLATNPQRQITLVQ